MHEELARGKERIWGWLAWLSSASIPLLLSAIVLVLSIYAWPAIVWNGWTFLSGRFWSMGNLYGGAPVTHHGFQAAAGAVYGALPFLAGTLLSSLLALLLAVPIGVAAAVCLAELAPPRLANALGFFVELLAGVPSVVFGLWGFMVLVPWIGHHLGPALAHHLGFVPFFSGPIQTGSGLLAAGMVLAAMVLPIIASVSRDALKSVPHDIRDQGRALGLTDWEVVQGLVMRAAMPGILGGIVLAMGRALGETMAVLMVSGNAVNYLPYNVYSPISTMASAIVSLLDSAMQDSTGMAVHALAELAVMLFLITLLVNLALPSLAGAMRRRWSNS